MTYPPRSSWTGHIGPDAHKTCATPEHWTSNVGGGWSGQADDPSQHDAPRHDVDDHTFDDQGNCACGADNAGTEYIGGPQ